MRDNMKAADVADAANEDEVMADVKVLTGDNTADAAEVLDEVLDAVKMVAEDETADSAVKEGHAEAEAEVDINCIAEIM